MKPPERQNSVFRWLTIALLGFALTACSDESQLEESVLLDAIAQDAERPELWASSIFDNDPLAAARALRNLQITSCYARLAQIAYESPANATRLCNSSQSKDNRNGMGAWEFHTSWQPTTASQAAILQIWQRTSAARVEIAIVLRGSSSFGDWVQDLKSQGFIAQTAQDNAISNLSSNLRLPNTGGLRRFHAGFIARANNLAPVIDQRLDWAEAPANLQGRDLGVKVVGHSLGAAAATIVGTYVANRYWDNPSARDVEVFAYNSPMATNGDMAYMIRNAGSYCRFNVHVFNNSADVVSMVPTPARHIYSGVKINYDPPEGCRYEGHYTAHFGRQDDSEGLSGWVWNKIASANPISFALNRHAISQWILEESTSHIARTDLEVAERWLPDRDIGSNSTPHNNTRPDSVEGVFTAMLISDHFKFVTAEGNGGGDVTSNRTTGSTWERFRFIPENPNCVEHGDHVVLATTGSNGEFFFRANAGRLDARATAATLDQRSSFTLLNHTSQTGCLREWDSISLRAHDGRYVSAQPGGAMLVDRTVLGPWEEFSVYDPHNIIPRGGYNDSALF